MWEVAQFSWERERRGRVGEGERTRKDKNERQRRKSRSGSPWLQFAWIMDVSDGLGERS